MEENTMPNRGFWYELYKIFISALILIGSTVLISIAYKVIIEFGFFLLIRNVAMHKFIFCLFELLLLLAYWYYLYRFSIIRRLNSGSPKRYYIQTLIVFALFNIAYWLSYFLLSREVNMWFFRATYNLICFTLKTTAPANLIPYMLAYLAVTLLIMLLEPVFAKISYNKWIKEAEQNDDEEYDL